MTAPPLIGFRRTHLGRTAVGQQARTPAKRNVDAAQLNSEMVIVLTVVPSPSCPARSPHAGPLIDWIMMALAFESKSAKADMPQW